MLEATINKDTKTMKRIIQEAHDINIPIIQIKDKRYALSLKDYTGKKLAVGISYDKKLKSHKIKVEDIDDSYHI